jgi:outer membrane protein assembly factor BamB
MRSLICVLLALRAVSAAPAADWPLHAGDAARSSIAPFAPRDFARVLWTVQPGPDEEFVSLSTPVAAGGRVFVNAQRFVDNVHEGNLLIAYDAATGQRRWSQPVEADVLDSISSPAVDPRNAAVSLACGRRVYTFDAASGSPRWQTMLDRQIVNASPAVTTDRIFNSVPANRLLIADYSGAGGGAQVYAINVDPFHSTVNPYQPGQIVWSAPISGATGSTPAYLDGVVVVASYRPEMNFIGEVRAFDVADGRELWMRSVGGDDGFFGGVTVRNGHVYAATYDFYGGANNSRLFKLHLDSGQVIWSIPAERTISIPVVTDAGRIYLSGGIAGFGSNSRVQAFQDQGASVSPVWDTYADSGGMLRIGGWQFQPVVSRGWLYVGRPDPDSFFGPNLELHLIDPRRTPDEPDFIVATHTGSGGSPAVSCGRMYSIGAGGLYALDISPACLGDINGNGLVNHSDLASLLAAFGTKAGERGYNPEADLDCDDAVKLGDLAILLPLLGRVCP